MISLDDGVIPCGRGIGCSFTAPSPGITNKNELPTRTPSAGVFYATLSVTQLNLPISFNTFTSFSRSSILYKKRNHRKKVKTQEENILNFLIN